jgi:CheY-like chemotaxis protein
MSYQFQNITVLIVEDNQPMLELAKALMTAFGVKNVLGAKHGEEGFKKFCEHNPDIIIADWMMKPMDGITLAHRIRNDPGLAEQIRAVCFDDGLQREAPRDAGARCGRYGIFSETVYGA